MILNTLRRHWDVSIFCCCFVSFYFIPFFVLFSFILFRFLFCFLFVLFCVFFVFLYFFMVSPGTLVSSTNKTDHHDIAEILLKEVISNPFGFFFVFIFVFSSVFSTSLSCTRTVN